MQVKVDINKVEIVQTEQINSGEYNTRQIQFNIAENMQGLILKALFTKDYKTYEADIENDSCMIPWEALECNGNCELGVYAYSVNGEVLEIRYSPEPTKFYINAGSYKTEVENGEQPTPTRSEVLEGKIKELDNKKVDKKEGYGLSQNDFTNELKDKLDNAGKQEDIDKLKAENEQQAEQISYLDKTLTRAEASGENINIKDSANYPFSDFNFDTNIKQDKRDGYNELNITSYLINDNITITNNTNTSIEIATIDYTKVSMIWFKINNLKAGIKYKASVLTKIITGLMGGGTGRLELYKTDKTWLKEIAFYNSDKQLSQGVFTVNEDGNYLIRYLLSETGKLTETLKVKLTEFMVYDYTSQTDKPYEQYGSMPSIEFPSEIKTPVGKQEVVVGNKNLISEEDFINTLRKYFTVTDEIYNGVECYKIIRSSSWEAKYDLSKELKFGDNYTISLTGIIVGSVALTIRNEEKKKILDVLLKTWGKQTFTANNITELYVAIYNTDATSNHIYIAKNSLQIEKGDTGTEIIEHQSQVQDLDLTSELLGPIVDKEDGSYFENRYGRIILDGSEEWLYNGTNVGYRYYLQEDINLYAVAETDVIPNILSNMFKAVKMTNTWNGKTGISSQYNSNLGYSRLNLCYVSDETDTVEKWKNWLSINKPEVVYPLATPTYTKLTDEQQAQWNKIKKMHTYEGVTNIYTINENGISPVINMKYVKSPKVVEENLQAQIDKLKNSIISMGGNV